MSQPIVYRDHLVLPADPRLSVLLPHAKHMQHNGQAFLVVPHSIDETKVLTNLGYTVRPPIMSQYQWPGPPPFDAQRITAAGISTYTRYFVLNGIGTGKTRSFLYAFDFLKAQGIVARALVVAPLSTVRQTWAKELMTIFPHLTFRVLTGDKKKRLKLLAEQVDIYIINHDGVEVIKDDLIAREDIDMGCLDELSVYKDGQTDRWKFTNTVTRRMKYLCGMTASPVPNAPTDAYGQTKIININAMPQSFTRFREKVQFKVTNFKWCNRPEALDIVFKTMQPAVRFTRDECYDLPECQIVTREAPLTPEQKALYAKVADECAASVAAGDIKAVNEADRINKLTQIALGAVYTTDKSVVELPCRPRLDILHEAVEQSASKTIVFTPYKHSLRMISEYLCKQGFSCGTISGDTSHHERESIFHNFMNTPNPQVIVAHPLTMSHGLTLTEASTIVWYGPPLSLETFEQSNGRITRAGQKFAQLIVCIAATRLELRIYERLKNRSEIQGLLLDMYESQELGALL